MDEQRRCSRISIIRRGSGWPRANTDCTQREWVATTATLFRTCVKSREIPRWFRRRPSRRARQPIAVSGCRRTHTYRRGSSESLPDRGQDTGAKLAPCLQSRYTKRSWAPRWRGKHKPVESNTNRYNSFRANGRRLAIPMSTRLDLEQAIPQLWANVRWMISTARSRISSAKHIELHLINNKYDWIKLKFTE